MELDPATKDFYNQYDPYQVLKVDREEYTEYIEDLTEDEKAMLRNNKHIYEIQFSSPGGLVMPIIIEFTFKDGSKQKEHIPAEIWRFNQKKVTKVFFLPKEVVDFNLDPNLETADIDRSNNYWPPRVLKSKFELFKEEQEQKENKMQRSKRSK